MPRRKGNGVGKGEGWGGPPKGPGSGSERHTFAGAGPGRGNYTKEGEARLERQTRHAEEMKELLYELAHGGVREETRMNAAEKLLNRIEGLPVQRVLNADVDPLSMLDDVALEGEIQATRDRLGKLNELRGLDEGQKAIGPAKVEPPSGS